MQQSIRFAGTVMLRLALWAIALCATYVAIRWVRTGHAGIAVIPGIIVITSLYFAIGRRFRERWVIPPLSSVVQLIERIVSLIEGLTEHALGRLVLLVVGLSATALAGYHLNSVHKDDTIFVISFGIGLLSIYIAVDSLSWRRGFRALAGLALFVVTLWVSMSWHFYRDEAVRAFDDPGRAVSQAIDLVGTAVADHLYTLLAVAIVAVATRHINPRWRAIVVFAAFVAIGAIWLYRTPGLTNEMAAQMVTSHFGDILIMLVALAAMTRRPSRVPTEFEMRVAARFPPDLFMTGEIMVKEHGFLTRQMMTKRDMPEWERILRAWPVPPLTEQASREREDIFWREQVRKHSFDRGNGLELHPMGDVLQYFRTNEMLILAEYYAATKNYREPIYGRRMATLHQHVRKAERSKEDEVESFLQQALVMMKQLAGEEEAHLKNSSEWYFGHIQENWQALGGSKVQRPEPYGAVESERI